MVSTSTGAAQLYSPQDQGRTLAGAGFSGLLTSLNLLRDPAGPRVRLLEIRAAFGRGVAYSTREGDYLLNVRASNMSAFPDDPKHFLNWLSAENDGSKVDGDVFVSRGLYGADIRRRCSCGLDLDVDFDGRLLDRQGRASPSLFGVGPLTRGALWAVASVPDIRLRAKNCAHLLLRDGDARRSASEGVALSSSRF